MFKCATMWFIYGIGIEARATKIKVEVRASKVEVRT